MPDSGARILDLVAAAPDARDFAALPKRLAPGTALPPPAPVFPRYVDAEAG